MSASGPICFLVHGTFASKTRWVSEQSELSGALKRAGAETRGFRWTGGNSPAARRVAGVNLRRDILEIAARENNRPIYLIGHSHGGNVIRHALDEELSKKITACFFLGTPFLHYLPRNIPLLRKTFIPILIITIALLFFRLTVAALAQQFPAGFVGAVHSNIANLAFQIVIGILSGSVCLSILWILFLNNVRSYQHVLRRELWGGFGRRRVDYVFFSKRDEANRLLNGIDLVSDISFKMIRHLQRVIVVSLRHFNIMRKILCILVSLYIIAAGMCAYLGEEATAAFSNKYGAFVLATPALGLIGLSSTMIISVFLISTISTVGWAFGVVLRSSFAAFGWEGFLTHALFDIRVQHFPRSLESGELHLIECSFDQYGKGLQHSQFYRSTTIAEFISGVIVGNAEIPATLRRINLPYSHRTRRVRFWSWYCIPAYVSGAMWISLIATGLFEHVSSPAYVHDSFDSITRTLNESGRTLAQ